MTSFGTSATRRLPRCTFFGPKATRSPSAAKMLVEKAPPRAKAANSCHVLKEETVSAPKAAPALASCVGTKAGMARLAATDWSAPLSTNPLAIMGAGGRCPARKPASTGSGACSIQLRVVLLSFGLMSKLAGV